MKILKILLIILVPAIGIVGCKKSDMKPGCNQPAMAKATDSGNNASVNKTNANNTDEATETNASANVAARMVGGVVVDDETVSVPYNDFVGSGDDDRDGGDKKRKK